MNFHCNGWAIARSGARTRVGAVRVCRGRGVEPDRNDECDRTARGGHRQRQRDLHLHPARHHGDGDAPGDGAGRRTDRRRGATSGTAGQSLTAVVAHVDDANPAANANNLSGQITWGDRTTTADTVTSAAGGGFDVSGTHTATPLATTRSAPPSPTSAAAQPAPTPPPKSHPSHHHRDRRRSSRLLPHLPAAPTASASTVSPAARARPARSRLGPRKREPLTAHGTMCSIRQKTARRPPAGS